MINKTNIRINLKIPNIWHNSKVEGTRKVEAVGYEGRAAHGSVVGATIRGWRMPGVIDSGVRECAAVLSGTHATLGTVRGGPLAVESNVVRRFRRGAAGTDSIRTPEEPTASAISFPDMQPLT